MSHDDAGARPRRIHRRSSRSERARANADAYRTPREVAIVLNNGAIYGHRFTPLQWMILALAWGGWTGYRTSEYVARQLAMKPSAVRQARKAAEQQAIFLVNVWQPTVRRWHRIRNGNPYGEELTDYERKVLHTNRYVKGGRKPVMPTNKDIGGSRAGAGGRDLPAGGMDW